MRYRTVFVGAAGLLLVGFQVRAQNSDQPAGGAPAQLVSPRSSSSSDLASRREDGLGTWYDWQLC